MGSELSGAAFVSLPRPVAARAAVRSIVGYRTEPASGEHRGLPSPYLTLVFSLAGAFPINIPAGTGMRCGSFGTPVGGLHTRAVLMPRRLSEAPAAAQRGIQLAVHPLAARTVFGLPASGLINEVVELGEVVGSVGPLGELPAGPPGADAEAPSPGGSTLGSGPPPTLPRPPSSSAPGT